MRVEELVLDVAAGIYDCRYARHYVQIPPVIFGFFDRLRVTASYRICTLMSCLSFLF